MRPVNNNTVVSRKYAPPFATLALVQNVGGAYTRDATISLAITPSLPIKHDSLGGGEAKHKASLSARRRDAPDASGRLTSFSVEGRESSALPRSSWRIHRWCGRFAFAVDTLTVDSRVAKIKIISVIRLQDKSSSGGGTYARDKNTSAGL